MLEFYHNIGLNSGITQGHTTESNLQDCPTDSNERTGKPLGLNGVGGYANYCTLMKADWAFLGSAVKYTGTKQDHAERCSGVRFPERFKLPSCL